MSRVQDLIREITADRRVTEAEWLNGLRPALMSMPPRASTDTRAVAELFASDEYEVDRVAQAGLQEVLQRFGYDAPERRPERQPPSEFLDELVKSNVGERDDELDRLSALVGKTSGQVTVAVLDGGFDVRHAELDAKLWQNPGEIEGDGLDNDGNGLADDVHGYNFAEHKSELKAMVHGTHVAGIATAGTDRIDAIAAVAFDRDVADGLQGVEIAQAIDYAAAHGARVLNMSFSVNDDRQLGPILDAIRRHPEVLFVKSAGNNGANRDRPIPPEHGGPGDLLFYDPNSFLGRQVLPNMAVIAAADESGHLADYSNWGIPWATHAAPGDRVLSAVDGDDYRRLSGTSQAAPRFSNAAAKMLLLDGALTPAQLKSMLAKTSEVSPAWDRLVASSGTINADRALRLAALTGLIRGGEDPQAAATRIGLSGAERERLLMLAAQYVSTGA